MKKDCSILKSRIAALTHNEPGFFSIAVIDPLTGKEISVDSRPMRSASLIKLFIMAEAFSGMTEGRLLPGEILSIRECDRVGGAGILQELPSGTCRTVLELVELMITESDNIATNLLIDRLGLEAINARIQRMGCADSCLRRHMMDFAAASEGRENMTSVLDAARALHQILHDQCVNSVADSSMREILGRQTDRCKIPLLLPPGTHCQHKTGELPGAEHDAGIVYGPAGPYVVAIMSDGLTDPERGREVISRLSLEIFKFFADAH